MKQEIKIRERLGKEKSGQYIDPDDKKEYLIRLNTPYEKKNQIKTFISQYNSGDGNDLKKKFWSVHSSSRYAFEAYSWLANEKSCLDIEFEMKLPALTGYSVGAPNMDVYIEFTDKNIFIESKLLECEEISLSKLSESYYKEKSELKNLKGILKERYDNDIGLSKKIPDFIMEIFEMISNMRIEAAIAAISSILVHSLSRFSNSGSAITFSIKSSSSLFIFNLHF